MRDAILIITFCAITVITFIVIMINLHEHDKKINHDGQKFIMSNGVIGTQIERCAFSRDFDRPTVRLEWIDINGRIFKAWFKAEELRRVADAETNTDHTY